MNIKAYFVILVILSSFLVISCSPQVTNSNISNNNSNNTLNKTVEIANPASQKCVNDGFKLVIRNADDGGQIGYCIFPDNSECEEWSYFRGECNYSKH